MLIEPHGATKGLILEILHQGGCISHTDPIAEASGTYIDDVRSSPPNENALQAQASAARAHPPSALDIDVGF